MSSSYICVVLVLAVVSARAQLPYWAASSFQNQLNPVSGLYVKPSVDGTTGDLYVAATEDSGVQSQWVADRAINILPTGAASQAQATIPAVNFAPSLTPGSSPQGEALLTTQKQVSVNSPMQYSLATSIPANMLNPYSYAMATINAIPGGDTEEISNPTENLPTKVIKTHTHYMPLQVLYSSLMNPATPAAENDNTDEIKNEVTTLPAAWPYPYQAMQYVMMNPAFWNANQATVVGTPIGQNKQAGTPDATDNDKVQAGQ